MGVSYFIFFYNYPTTKLNVLNKSLKGSFNGVSVCSKCFITIFILRYT